MATLPSRGRIVRYFDDALRRPGVPDRPLPITLLIGPRGSGATVLLTQLWHRYVDTKPSIYLDLAEAQRVPDVVFAIMQGLRRHVLGIRVIEFPLLELAFKALDFPDEGDGLTAFEEYMRGGGGEAGPTLLTLFGEANKLLPNPVIQVLAAVLEQALERLVRGSGRRHEGRHLAWYANHRVVGGSGGGIGALWRLHGWYHGNKRDAVSKVLCDALLADVRSDFNDHRRFHGQRTMNALVLLDNAGGEVGERLLNLIAECRAENARQGELGDPLVIGAAHRGRHRLTAQAIDTTDPDLRFVEPTVDPDAALPERWYPVRLTNLTEDTVSEMARSSVVGSVDHDAAFVYELTGGHPGASATLVELLDAYGSSGEPRDLLDWVIPQRLRARWDIEDPTTVEDWLLATVLGHAPGSDQRDGDGGTRSTREQLLDAMAACAATPDMRLGACNAVFRFVGWDGLMAVDVRDEMANRLWIDETSEGFAHPHPVVALLLRRWLARDTDMWRAVHEGFVVHYAAPNDDVLRRHHHLALVEPSRRDHLDEVVGYLERLFEVSAPREWLAALSRVTSAPNRLRTNAAPSTFVTTLAGVSVPGDRTRIITRLTVAKWLYNDRCFDPRHQLAEVISHEFGYLGELCPSDGELFYIESARHSRTVAEWRQRS